MLAQPAPREPEAEGQGLEVALHQKAGGSR